jgi:hypothetical protein
LQTPVSVSQVSPELQVTPWQGLVIDTQRLELLHWYPVGQLLVVHSQAPVELLQVSPWLQVTPVQGLVFGTQRLAVLHW